MFYDSKDHYRFHDWMDPIVFVLELFEGIKKSVMETWNNWFPNDDENEGKDSLDDY